MSTVLVVAALVAGSVYMAKEIRGCESDISGNIATCIESGGDAYLCCINYSMDKDDDECLEKEKARKLSK